MKVKCVWEHNGDDTMLFAIDFVGAYARGENKEIASKKMENEIYSYLKWLEKGIPQDFSIEITQDYPCNLNVKDADSDVIFESEKEPLTYEEYESLKVRALKSSKDFLALYEGIPDKKASDVPERKTFYGKVPSNAEEMYLHTKNVNEYYFAEINVNADNQGNIYECRLKGFEALEKSSDFLKNSVIEGSYGEMWSLRKVLRRFIWHDRIHAKAMYRMATRVFGKENIPNPFAF